MQPGCFNINDPKQDYVYYSLQLPTYLESVPRTRNPISARADIVKFESLVEQFMYELETNPSLEAPLGLHDIFNQIQFEYFHNSEDQFADIQPSSRLPEQDPRFMYLPEAFKDEGRIFCERGTFVRGCIRISRKS